MERNRMLELLGAEGPPQDGAAGRLLYAGLVGSWTVESVWHGSDGGRDTATGEWHFGWVLGGAGVQDVLFADAAARHEYGTSLRCYYPALDAWRITWMQPSSGEVAHLVGRAEGGRIVQEGTRADGRSVRWCFADVTADAFLWTGEISEDEGRTWFLRQEMRGRRR